jgi:tetratricopeptide (TPR) repeat protein
MSLIVDALKKAQQLRLKESKEMPSSTSSPDRKESLRRLRERWIIIGISLASLITFFLISVKISSPPPPSMPIQTSFHMKKKTPVTVNPVRNSNGALNPAGNILKSDPAAEQRGIISNGVNEENSQEFLKDMMSLPKDVLSLPKDIPTLSKDKPSYPHMEKVWAGGGPSAEKKKEETLFKQIPEKKEIAKIIPPMKTSPPSLKKPTSTKSIEVKREVDKDHPFAYEILVHFNSGVQFYQQRNFLKAIQAYQKVIKLDPTYIEAYNNLGIIYQELGDFDRAFEAYRKSIEINPQYEKGYNNLGILYYLQGRNEEALEAFQKALAINSSSIETHINLGVLFKKQGQLNKAIESYQNALEIDPLLREVHYNIALLYEQLDNIELAVGHYVQFIRLSSANHSDLVSKVQRHLDDLIKTGNEKRK